LVSTSGEMWMAPIRVLKNLQTLNKIFMSVDQCFFAASIKRRLLWAGFLRPNLLFTIQLLKRSQTPVQCFIRFDSEILAQKLKYWFFSFATLPEFLSAKSRLHFFVLFTCWSFKIPNRDCCLLGEMTIRELFSSHKFWSEGLECNCSSLKALYLEWMLYRERSQIGWNWPNVTWGYDFLPSLLYKHSLAIFHRSDNSDWTICFPVVKTSNSSKSKGWKR
jgi:hypothetical protein